LKILSSFLNFLSFETLLKKNLCVIVMTSVKVYSLNYDFVPTYAYGVKCLWADLRWPAPENLKIGQKIFLSSSSKHLIIPGDSSFHIENIVGSRVILRFKDPTATLAILTYFTPKNDSPKEWSPLDHSPHWGYATRDLANKNPAADRNWTYGNGESVLNMIW
jgi:hypothetical protein